MFLFRNPTARQLNLALAALRITVGTIFIAHGAQKLFTFGFAGVTGAFGHMGIPFPGVMGPFIALLEFIGGIAILLGLLTRLASLGMVFNMLGAIVFVHFKGGFFLPAGAEYAFALLGSSLALVFAGAGQFSIDAVLDRTVKTAAKIDARRGTTLRAA
ncbi:MAG: DoxX family protein [Gemmatimonadaceae bacterium]